VTKQNIKPNMGCRL